MFGEKPLHSSSAPAGRQVVERRVAFPQSYDLVPIVQGRQNFAKTPDAAFIEGIWRSAALQPELFERGRVEASRTHPGSCLPAGKNYFQQIATLRAADALGPVFAHGSARNATQLRDAQFQF